MKKIDYSSEAITRRLRQTEQLRVLSLSLISAKEAYDKKLSRDKSFEPIANIRPAKSKIERSR